MTWEFDELLKAIKKGIQEGTASEWETLTKSFNTPIMNIVKTQWVTSNCSDIIFINLTPLTVLTNGNIQVNNYVLQPGGYFGVNGNNAEINTDQYNVVFDALATQCVVIKKLYTKK